jgi:glycine/serine hydroxymethyltransferase
MYDPSTTLAGFDPELAAVLRGEEGRQEDHAELIASERPMRMPGRIACMRRASRRASKSARWSQRSRPSRSTC